MKPLMFLAATAALAVPTLASANCYYVFSPQNTLVYRSVLSPIDLSKPISSSVRARFGGGHMTMVPDETGCPDLGPVGEQAQTTGANAGPFASPLFRSAESRSAYDDAGGITSSGGTNSSAASQQPSQRRR